MSHEKFVSGRQANNAKRAIEEYYKNQSKFAGTMSPPQYRSDVLSVFQVRPVNAVDTLFKGDITIAVPQGAACANPGNDAPLTPWTQNFGAVAGNFAGSGGQVAPNETVGGSCVQTTVYARISGATRSSAFAYQIKTNDGLSRPGTFDAYGYDGTDDTNGVLVTQNLGFTIPTIDFDGTTTVILNFGQYVVGHRYTAILTSSGDAVPDATGLSIFASFVAL